MEKLVKESFKKKRLMSSQGLFYSPVNASEERKNAEIHEMLMVPLKDVEVKATLEGSHAIIYYDILYVNPG